MAAFKGPISRVQDIAPHSDIDSLLEVDKEPWWKKRNLRALYAVLIPTTFGVEMTVGYDGSIINGLQSVQGWLDYFDHPRGAMFDVVISAFSVGALIAVPFVPWINDRFGRGACIGLGALIMLVGTALQASAGQLATFCIARLILGFGIMFGTGGASQLLAELAHPKDRDVCLELFFESWYAGSVVAAGIT